MPGNERITRSIRLKVIDMPRSKLTPSDAQASNLIAVQIKRFADNRLGQNLEQRTISGNYMYLIARPASFHGDLYDGADVVIEKFKLDSEREIVEREYSYAFYPEVTINRPNRSLYYEDTMEDNSTRRRVERASNDANSNLENYEVGASELNQLKDQLLKLTSN